jgi:hypothetical protein
MTSPETIPLIDQVAADCLRGMLADQYFKPDDKREGARQAYQLARALLEPHQPGRPAVHPPESTAEWMHLHLHFSRAALSGMLANPHVRHASAEEWSRAAFQWAENMLVVRGTP